MSTIGYTWWLSTQVLLLLLAWWPVMLVLVLASILAARREGRERNDQLKSLPAVLWLFPVLILLWAGVARLEAPGEGGIAWRLAVLGLLITLQALTSAALVYIARGHRLYTAAFCAILGWIGGLCAYVGVLAVTAGLAPG